MRLLERTGRHQAARTRIAHDGFGARAIDRNPSTLDRPAFALAGSAERCSAGT